MEDEKFLTFAVKFNHLEKKSPAGEDGARYCVIRGPIRSIRPLGARDLSARKAAETRKRNREAADAARE